MRAIKWLLFMVIAPKAFADSTLLQRLAAGGFQCQASTYGNLCIVDKVQTTDFSYSQSVAVLVPPNVDQPQQTLLYLHGFRGVCEADNTSAQGMITEFNFSTQLQQAHITNAVMVVPISLGQCTTYTQELIPHFNNFITWINSLTLPTANSWIVGGHSGSGAILAQILAQNVTFVSQVKAVLLLDAAYSMPDYIASWQTAVSHDPGLSIYSVYTTPDGTEPGSEQLKSTLTKTKVVLEVANPNQHCVVPNEFASLLSEAETGL